MSKHTVRYVTAPLPDDLDKAFNASDDLKRQLADRRNSMIGRSLRYARDAVGLKQQDVAAVMGVEQSRISQIEGAEGHSISLGVLARYATAVGCAVNIDLVNKKTRKLVTRVFVSSTPTAGVAAHTPVTPMRPVPATAFRSGLSVTWDAVPADSRQPAQQVYDNAA